MLLFRFCVSICFNFEVGLLLPLLFTMFCFCVVTVCSNDFGRVLQLLWVLKSVGNSLFPYTTTVQGLYFSVTVMWYVVGVGLLLVV